MRILYVNKFGTATSGAENYFLQLADRVGTAGHDVAVMCGRPRDVPASVQRTFPVDVADFRAHAGVAQSARHAAGVIWSRQAAAAMTTAIQRFRPQIVHFHNYYHHLSSSVVQAANRAGVRTVMTAHDYKVICPAYVALREGQECFACADRVSPLLLKSRCLHGDLAWSTVAAVEAVVTRRARAVPQTIIAPSEYLAARVREGWPRATSDVVLLRNPVAFTKPAPNGSDTTQPHAASGSYVLYLGRLAPEKGVDVVVRAASASGVKLVVAGDGPESENLRRLAQQLGAPVEFLGHVAADQVGKVLAGASATVVPSTWPENAPLSVLEALVVGVPAIVAAVGGLPELIDIAGGGMVVDAQLPDAWAKAMLAAAQGSLPAPDADAVRREFGWEKHLDGLAHIYRSMESRA